MLLSYCLPCHRRTDDLLRSLPYALAAADISPPVEIVIVDYGEQAFLAPLLADLAVLHTDPQNRVIVPRFRGWPYYHMAHARNVSIQNATGEFVIITSTDICPKPEFFAVVRRRLEESGATWLRARYTDFIGVVVCRREELLAAGGYDERLEFYGSEDKDLQARLCRRGSVCAEYNADEVLTMWRTPNAEKIANYRLPLSKMEMLQFGDAIVRENVKLGVLVANEGHPWGVV